MPFFAGNLLFAEYFVYQLVVGYVRHCDFQFRGAFHFPLYREDGAFVTCPAAACYTVVYVPEEHFADMPFRVAPAVDNHAEASVYDFSPAYADAIMERYPCGSPERVAYYIMDGHVGCECRTVIDVGSFTVRRIGSGYIVMVASEYDRGRNFAFPDGFVESKGYLGTAFTVGIEDARL